MTSLRVHTVFYRPAPGDFDRFIRGLRNAVRVAAQQDPGLQVSVIVGDGSPIPALTVEQTEELGESLRPWGIDRFAYDYFDANLGSAGGHNRLLDGFDEDFVLILNPDVFASPFLLPELFLPHADSRVGIVEARQIPLEHPKRYDPDSGDTSWASTAGALVRRAVIDKVGVFDADSFFLYCDDVDFSWRTRLAGFRVVHQPAARIFHDKRITLEGRMEVGDAEHYYAAEAAMMLAWKYSRPDLAEEWFDSLSRSEMPLQRKAADRFRERRAAGTLPEPLDPSGRVAEFIGINFAEHRFSYDDD